MKRISISVVVVVVAALGCMALAGTSSAFAEELTVLCKTSAEPCEAADIYPEGTTITAKTTASTGPLKINTYSVHISCASTLEATVGERSGESQLLSVNSWTLGSPSEACSGLSNKDCGEANGEGLPYEAEAHLSANDIFTRESGWHLICKIGGITYGNCTYYSGELPLSLGNHRELSVTELSLSSKGTTCIKNPELTARYEITSPETPVYVSWVESPSASTKAATGVTATGATLNGTVNPGGNATNYYFEYGTTTSYGSKTTITSAGSGVSDVAVSKAITGLTVDTPYHFRLVAEAEGGLRSYGEDRTIGPVYRGSFGEADLEEGQFYWPAGVAVDPSGDLWVVNHGMSQVEKWSPSGEFLFSFGEEGEEPGQFSSPSSVAIDSSGDVWVADTGNNRIEEFSAEGEFIRAVGEEGQFQYPEAVGIDTEGHVWVGDTANGRLQEFDSEGAWMHVVNGGGRICTPTGLAFSSVAVYVADRCNNRIEEFTDFGKSVGTFVREWGTIGTGDGQFKHPDALAVDAEHHVWVVDEGNDRVQEFTGGGEYISKFGAEGWGPGKFEFLKPTGIVTDPEGNIWISDTLNDRVQEWSR